MRKTLALLLVFAVTAVVMVGCSAAKNDGQADNGISTADNTSTGDMTHTATDTEFTADSSSDKVISGEPQTDIQDDTATADNRFSIVFNGKSVSLLEWDNKTDIKSVFGEPVSEETEVIGEGGDTFTGSFVKTMKYDGLELILFSPKDNGKSFYILSMTVTGDKYTTSNGAKVGDNIDNLKNAYPGIKRANDDSSDDNNCAYVIRNEDNNCITFTVNNGLISEIVIENELQ